MRRWFLLRKMPLEKAIRQWFLMPHSCLCPRPKCLWPVQVLVMTRDMRGLVLAVAEEMPSNEKH